MNPHKGLARRLHAWLKPRLDPRVKDATARHLTRRLVRVILGQPMSAWGPVHENFTRTVDHLASLPDETVARLFEEITSVLLVGYVVPVQEVHKAIDASRGAWLASCVCRKTRRVEDLYRPGTRDVVLTCGEEAARPYLDALLDAVRATHHRDMDTDPALMDILMDLVAAPEPRTVASLFERTWPHQELLLDHPDYIQEWRRAHQAAGNAWRIHPDLLHAWVDLAYYVRGVVFTSMSSADARYTICSCPGPENDGGCLLFNWHYFSGNPHTVTVDPDFRPGPRRGPDGRVLLCARYRERQVEACLGCGCGEDLASDHRGRPDPRPVLEDREP